MTKQLENHHPTPQQLEFLRQQYDLIVKYAKNQSRLNLFLSVSGKSVFSKHMDIV